MHYAIVGMLLGILLQARKLQRMSRSGKCYAVSDIINRVVMANAEDAQSTIYEAHENFRSGVWSKSSAANRAEVLGNLADVLSVRMEEFAYLESMQTGRPIREMKAQLGRLPEWL